MRCAAAFTLLFLAACSEAPATAVDAFVTRAEECGHFAGEERHDAARGAEIDAAFARLRCTDLPADAAALKRRRDLGREDLARINRALEWM